MSASERIELCQRMVAEIRRKPGGNAREFHEILLVLEQQALALAELRDEVRSLKHPAEDANVAGWLGERDET